MSNEYLDKQANIIYDLCISSKLSESKKIELIKIKLKEIRSWNEK